MVSITRACLMLSERARVAISIPPLLRRSYSYNIIMPLGSGKNASWVHVYDKFLSGNVCMVAIYQGS